MGDGIMAVFGAPLEQDDHADRALEAARELVGPRLDAFNAWLRERGGDWTAVIGVGIHSGPVASGMVGSERRLEYAAVGDTTNTAARLESATKELGVSRAALGRHARAPHRAARRARRGRHDRGQGARAAGPRVDAARAAPGRPAAAEPLGN